MGYLHNSGPESIFFNVQSKSTPWGGEAGLLGRTPLQCECRWWGVPSLPELNGHLEDQGGGVVAPEMRSVVPAHPVFMEYSHFSYSFIFGGIGSLLLHAGFL